MDAILEATGLLRKDQKGLEEIRRMDDKETRTFADSLWEQVQDHYKRNIPSTFKEIAGKNEKAPSKSELCTYKAL